MNAVILILCYLFACVSISFLYFSGALHRLGVITFLGTVVQQRCPSLFQYSRLSRWIRYALVVSYHIVLLTGHMIGIHDVVPHLSPIKSTSVINMTALMYHLWTFHTLSYLMCIMSNPGFIHRRNHRAALAVYAFDGKVYKPAQNCTTCEWEKPARSKHCSTCNRCVHRFDHHCWWINCCIGANNYRYFLALLITGIMIGCNCIAMCLQFFQLIYNSRGLHAYKYVDSAGQKQSVSGLVLCQYMLYEFPRVSIGFCSIVLLVFLLSFFTYYHIRLAVSNCTTNESYKLDELDESCRVQHAEIYNKGVLRNLLEIIAPTTLALTPREDKSD